MQRCWRGMFQPHQLRLHLPVVRMFAGQSCSSRRCRRAAPTQKGQQMPTSACGTHCAAQGGASLQSAVTGRCHLGEALLGLLVEQVVQRREGRLRHHSFPRSSMGNRARGADSLYENRAGSAPHLQSTINLSRGVKEGFLDTTGPSRRSSAPPGSWGLSVDIAVTDSM